MISILPRGDLYLVGRAGDFEDGNPRDFFLVKAPSREAALRYYRRWAVESDPFFLDTLLTGAFFPTVRSGRLGPRFRSLLDLDTDLEPTERAEVQAEIDRQIDDFFGGHPRWAALYREYWTQHFELSIDEAIAKADELLPEDMRVYIWEQAKLGDELALRLDEVEYVEVDREGLARTLWP
jgi:hypothetical protein